MLKKLDIPGLMSFGNLKPISLQYCHFSSGTPESTAAAPVLTFPLLQLSASPLDFCFWKQYVSKFASYPIVNEKSLHHPGGRELGPKERDSGLPAIHPAALSCGLAPGEVVHNQMEGASAPSQGSGNSESSSHRYNSCWSYFHQEYQMLQAMTLGRTPLMVKTVLKQTNKKKIPEIWTNEKGHTKGQNTKDKNKKERCRESLRNGGERRKCQGECRVSHVCTILS